MCPQDITIGRDASTGCGCGCGHDSTRADATASSTVNGDEITAAYGVTGMTCSHCVAAVKEEIGALPGVTEVSVDLVAGGTSTVTVRSATPVDEADIRAAVDEAGYSVAGGTS